MYIDNSSTSLANSSFEVDANGTASPTPISILGASFPLVMECSESPMFHLAFLGLLVAYLTPPSEYSSLLQHFLLSIAHLLWIIWFWSCSGVNAMFAWFLVLFLVNVTQTVYQAYLKRYHMLDPALEEAYKTIFQPIKVSRLEFKKLFRFGKMLQLQIGESYAFEGVTLTSKLALLLDGKISVYCKNHMLHSIGPNQFLDSPEWESTPSVLPMVSSLACYKQEYDLLTGKTRAPSIGDDRRGSIKYKPPPTIVTNSISIPLGENHFNVSLVATAPSQYICWDRRDLELYLLHNKDMANLLKLILARDITDKLYAMNERMTNEKGAQFDIRLPVIVSSLTMPTATPNPNRTNTGSPALEIAACGANH